MPSFLAKSAGIGYPWSMKNVWSVPPHAAGGIPPIPRWITAARVANIEDAALLSGAAIACLHQAAVSGDLPQALWRERLALLAAEACAGFSGRQERMIALRDAVHLARPSDHPGPAGEIFQLWRKAVARRISAPTLGQLLVRITPARIALCFDAGQGNPVARAAAALEAVLTEAPREEAAALILADAVLARCLGFDHVLPLLAAGLKPRDLRKTGDELRLACHRSVAVSAQKATRLAIDLSERAKLLEAATPKLRAKGAAKAIALFLSRDAVAPSALTGLMSDRAARRLCDRLVELGVLQELTGRETSRLYGV